MNGFLLIDKPEGGSSFDVIRSLRKVLGRKTKLGHAGTLDPFATGVLVVLVGKATRLMPYVVGHDKRYRMTVQLGGISNTDDIAGEISEVDAVVPTEEAVRDAIVKLAAKTQQTPPSVSAIHVEGERAYKRVRRGETLDLPPRSVAFRGITIVGMDLEKLQVSLDVRCSSGTYMRSLARDLGEALGCGGYAAKLRRIEVGTWTSTECLPLDQVATLEEARNHMRPMLELVDLPTARIATADRVPLAFGKSVAAYDASAEEADVAIVDGAGELLATGEFNGKEVQPRSVFIESEIPKRVVCLGVFDGVHRGHQQLLLQARSIADTIKSGGSVCAATFWPHPQQVVRGEAPSLIVDLSRRKRLLHHHGADEVVVIPFDLDMSRLSPEEFIQQWIVDRFVAAHVVVGPNFRFGHKGAGDTNVLTNVCATHGIEVHVCDAKVMTFETDESEGALVSSSRAREQIDLGNVENVAEMLGRVFTVDGTIRVGAQRGRTIGYPTANLHAEPGVVVPSTGVYAGRMKTAFGEFIAATSVGTNPQFEAGDEIFVESFLLDYSGEDLYDTRAELTLERRIRGQAVFDSVDDLIAQIGVDVADIREIMNSAATAQTT